MDLRDDSSREPLLLGGPASPRFALLTLGCRVNQYESGLMRKALNDMGFAEVPFEERADCYIINTCTVTHLADRKSRQMVRRALRRNPDAPVFAVGCGTQNDGEAMKSISPRIVVISNDEKQTLAARVADLIPPPAPRESGGCSPGGRTRALLKVQDGCSHRCSYCIVPSVRGPGRSRSIDEALQEAKILEMQGFKEIVVTGIHLSAWGADLPGEPDLSDLITDLIEGTALTRFRLSSLEPQNFPWGILDLMEKTQRLCPHLHLPLQHGSDAVLKRMRRGYTAAQFTTIVNDFNRRFPLGGLSTDILVGFPGETSDDADALRSLIEDLPFTRLHVFKYSRRPGTPAAGFPDQVSEADKDRRSREMIALGRGKAADFARRLVGTVQEVLVENELMRGTWEGTSANYAPVLIESGEQLGGLLVQVSITRCLRERVLGGLISS